MTNEEDIYSFIQIEQKNNNNKCGTRVVDVMHNFDMKFDDVSKILRKLYTDGKITSRKGINNNLIFLK